MMYFIAGSVGFCLGCFVMSFVCSGKHRDLEDEIIELKRKRSSVIDLKDYSRYPQC